MPSSSEQLLLSAEPGPAQCLQTAAAHHDIVLSGDRLEALIRHGVDIIERRERGLPVGFRDRAAGFSVYTIQVREDANPPTTYAQFDFMPKTGQRPGGAVDAQPQARTPLLFNFIRSWQDYMLLVEAGYLDRPDQFFGITLSTNTEMIKLAERFGFRGNGDGSLWADFDAVAEQSFSPNMRRLEAMLAQRMNTHNIRARGAFSASRIGFLANGF